MAKSKGGRPTKYSEELGNKLCSELALGQSLRTVCKSDDMPCVATVFNWFKLHEEFLEQYTRAKEESADALTDEMLDIADDASNDWMEKLDKEEQPMGYQLNGDHVQRSRLRIETRKWLASKLKPKKYGEKIQQEISGEVKFTDLTDEQLDHKLQSLINATSPDTPTED
jgi:hypothetical protein